MVKVFFLELWLILFPIMVILNTLWSLAFYRPHSNLQIFKIFEMILIMTQFLTYLICLCLLKVISSKLILNSLRICCLTKPNIFSLSRPISICFFRHCTTSALRSGDPGLVKHEVFLDYSYPNSKFWWLRGIFLSLCFFFSSLQFCKKKCVLSQWYSSIMVEIYYFFSSLNSFRAAILGFVTDEE